MQSNPKSKVCWSQPHAVGLFFSSRDWGTHQNRRKAQCTKIYRYSLNENPVQSIQNQTWVEDLLSNRTMTQSTQQEWLIDNSVIVLEWPSHSLSLNPIKCFWRNLKMCVCPHPTWQSLRGEEVRRKIADNCQMLMSKAWRIIPKNTWGCKATSAKYWIKGMNTYAMYF